LRGSIAARVLGETSFLFSHEQLNSATINEAIRCGGTLDLLVNCAGRQIIKRIEELKPEEWDVVLDVNLKGAYLCAQAALPFLAERRGAIVNICSVHARSTIEGFTSYAASKAGILALTRAMAIECAPRGVRVNAVSPGTIDTPMLQAFFDSCPDPVRARSEFLKFHPIGRFGTPRDVGEMVAFLGSAQAGFVTGTEVIVDGGMTALLFRQ
jgi:NAD(P)-dependent dehydrogenase (short-subunit alcohol dehydrogenase family)